MGCCGSNGSKQDNMRLISDVQVFAQYSPRKVRGAVTGRMYPKPDVQGLLWMDKRDAMAHPDKFHIIINAVEATPDIATVQALAKAALAPKPQPARVEDVSQEVSKPTEKPTPKSEPKAPQRQTKRRSTRGKKSA